MSREPYDSAMARAKAIVRLHAPVPPSPQQVREIQLAVTSHTMSDDSLSPSDCEQTIRELLQALGIYVKTDILGM